MEIRLSIVAYLCGHRTTLILENVINIKKDPSFLQNPLGSTHSSDLSSTLISWSGLHREILFIKILDYLGILTSYSQIVSPLKEVIINCHCYSCYIMIWHNILLGKLPETIQKWDSVPECTPDAGRCSRKLWWEGRVSTLSRENFHPRKSPHLGYCASYFSWFCLVLWNHPVSRAQATVCSISHCQAKSPTLSFPNLLSSFRSLCIWTVCPFSLFPPNLNCGKDSFFGGRGENRTGSQIPH